jgi:hypothetical protein
MPEPLLYWKAMGIAATASAVVVLAMLSLRRSVNETWLNAACVFGIGLGLAIGNAVLALNLSWPPRSGLDRLLMIVIPAVLGVELIAGFNRVPRVAAWLLRISLSLATPRILLHGSVYLSSSGDWTSWRAGATIVVCGLGLALVWSLLSWLSRRSGGLSISFALCLAIQCSGVAVMLAGYIKGGAAAIPLVATLLGAPLALRVVTKYAAHRVEIDKPDGFVAAGIVGVGVVSLFSLLFIGRFFGEISTGPALTMLLAPLLCWTTELPPLRNRKPWFVASFRLALVAIPLLVVLIAAKREFDREMSPLLGNARTTAWAFTTSAS